MRNKHNSFPTKKIMWCVFFCSASTIAISCSSNGGDRCLGNSNYCSGSYYTGSTCIDGYCRCPSNINRNPCTCLAHVGGCEIEEGAGIRVGTPTYDGSSQTTYSCVSGVRNQYEVHVISNYESDGQHGFGLTRTTGTTDVNLNVAGNGSIPLVLVFVSYEPVNWRLQVPIGVVIDTVLISSYYIDDSTVTYSSGKVENFEKLTYQTLPYGYGKDTGGGKTLDMLKTIVNRFGSVYSFSGSYRANAWTLNINRENTYVNYSPSSVTPSQTILTASSSHSAITTKTKTSACISPSPETEMSDESSCSSSVGDQCLGNSNYCSGSYYTGSTCIDGYCRCPGNINRDPCTCLARVGGCEIEEGAGIRVGTPTYDGSSQTTYSCVSGVHSQYEVHVISNYESDGQHGFGLTRTTGTTDVNLNVDGSSSIPLVLVFVSYEPVNWRLQVPIGVVIDTVLISSYYIDDSTVTYSSGKVENFEKLTYQTLPCGYGKDTGGCKTLDILQTVVNRFGSVYSFSGSYRANTWTLNIDRENSVRICNPSSVTPSQTIFTDSAITTTTSAGVSPSPETEISDESICLSNVGDECLDGDYCSGSYSIGATCVDGYCRCLGNVNRNPCTCLARVACCEVEEGDDLHIGTAAYEGSSQTTYSCVSGVRSQYEVHVISNYESNGQHGFGQTRTTGITDVNLNVDGNGSIPLVLVFVSYEPVNWILQIPSGVVIDTVMLSSYYIDSSTVTYSLNKVEHFEKQTYQEVPGGYGEDTGGGNTVDLLTAVINRFGSVYSFSGSYRADSWTLNINRENTSVNCRSSILTVSKSSPSISNTTSIISVTFPVFFILALSVIVIVVIVIMFTLWKRRQSIAKKVPVNTVTAEVI